ncbi:MAG TPA: VanZ family protein [Longimicrobiales bacterium]|nr:VanZ family protein [Longimicrobiales bacterium]
MRALAGYLPALLWAGTLLFLGSRPAADFPSVDLPLDKPVHFALYGVLGALAAVGWLRAGRRPPALLLLAGIWLLAAADELHQGRVPGRSPETWDWLMDVAGSGLAFAWVGRRGRRTDRDEERHES